MLGRAIGLEDLALACAAFSTINAPRWIRFENFFAAYSLGAAVLAILWVIVLNTQVSRLQAEISTLRDALLAHSNELQQIKAKLAQATPSASTVSLKGTDVQPQAQ